ncbi:uncharacterized protein At4g15545-like isoform X2 [Zingiber officinale]|uniref:At4g15545-like C-terminal domain-containing protein n=1 Tax=Zingiber officinale TaxID=94328 RepID=A0A8J5KZA3_ZINOF|nr:uncharacterized protein At4g15545-like isoform X2 [Zingiber officinale]KAG6495266.1 hypothetical protein ZIOFF_043060 [Zingiber officinale]
MAREATDFHLPDELLAVIPVDPYDQLDLARRIASLAITSRVSHLEGEADRLRQMITDRDLVIEDLHGKIARLDRLVQVSDARLRDIDEENAKLSRERQMLTTTSKKMARELSKLEMFKSQLMDSLSGDRLPQQSDSVDIGMQKPPIARVSSWRDDDNISQVVANESAEIKETGESSQDDPSMHQFSITPYISPKLTPTTTPKGSSTNGTPIGFSTIRSSPIFLSGATSPTTSQYGEHGSMSPLYASSQQSSTASSPPHRQSLPGRTSRTDGKELFRQARIRLSYEQFAAFLANVKEFNAHRQSSKDTLAKADKIFGTENKDLYLTFQSLVNRARQ